MIHSKKIGIITAVAICLAFALTVILYLSQIGEAQSASTTPEYASKVFGNDIINIEILADESDWQQMLDNAANEQYIMADVIVNGTKFQNVGIRPKGNSSLSQVLQSDSQRYSFRFQFNEYIKGQTCFGLESFVVNNMLGDNTYMKEYVSYDLMNEIGVKAPYFDYADIKVNGENWGLYLAVELYNDSYEQRVFGTESGMLYNVKSMDIGGNENMGKFPNIPNRGQGGEFPPAFEQRHQRQPQDNAQEAIQETTEISQNNWQPPDNITPPEDKMGGAMGGRNSNGGSLEYSDDNTSSYSAIFNNVVGKGSDSDYQRVIKALKALSEGNDLEKYFDVDQILRYLAAHTIVVNLDSYSSSMAQNYYIYENDGQLTILPWDYNLAWGGFQSSKASSVVNFPIDTPVSGIEMSSRPLLEKLFSNTDYLTTYHGYLQELIDYYFADGRFEAKVNELNSLISDYVKNDKTAFCSYEEYETAIESFITLGNLRAESVQGQLDKTVPSTTSEQNSNADKLVSADNLDLSVLGKMMNNKDRTSKDNFSGAQGDTQQVADKGMIDKRSDNSLYSSNSLSSNQTKESNVLLYVLLVLVLASSILIAAKSRKNY